MWKRLPGPRAVASSLVGGARFAAPMIIAVAAVGSLGAGAYYGHRWLVTSDRFAVSEIQLRGNQRLSDDHVRAVLGTTPGENIFRLDLSDLERGLERDPWIADAHVERRLPDTLRVTIEERTAAVLVDLGGLYLADASGRVFKRAAIQRGEGRGLPVVTGLTREEYLRAPDELRERIRSALTTARTYGANKARPALGEIRLDVRRGTTLYTYDTALAIRLGHGAGRDLATRMASFDSAWRALSQDEKRRAKRIHVDNPAQPDRITVAFAPTH